MKFIELLFWALPNGLFLLVPTQRSKSDGGASSHGTTNTSAEEKDPLLQHAMDWHAHTHTHTCDGLTDGWHHSSILSWNTVTVCWAHILLDCNVYETLSRRLTLTLWDIFVSRLSESRLFVSSGRASEAALSPKTTFLWRTTKKHYLQRSLCSAQCSPIISTGLRLFSLVKFYQERESFLYH